MFSAAAPQSGFRIRLSSGSYNDALATLGTMSGIEIIGVVLGTLPLLISGKTSMQSVSYWTETQLPVPSPPLTIVL